MALVAPNLSDTRNLPFDIVPLEVMEVYDSPYRIPP